MQNPKNHREKTKKIWGKNKKRKINKKKDKIKKNK